MENKNLKQTQQIQRDFKLNSKIKDRGDSFRKQDGGKVKTNEKSNFKSIPKPIVTDRGDSTTSKIAVAHQAIPNNNKTLKDKVNEKGKKLSEVKPKPDACPKVIIEADKTLNYKTSGTINAVNKTKVGEKKSTSDKVNARPKVSKSQNVKDFKSFEKSDLGNDRVILKSGSKEIITDSIKSEVNTESEVKKEKDIAHRKPLIKTVKSKNDKVYKAVTFTEKKLVKPMVLEISIPNMQAKKTKSKLVDKNLEAKIPTVTLTNNKSTSKLSVKEKTQHNRRNRVTERKKRKRLNRCISSPDKFKKVESPQTEVAKWAPSCLNAHTKPYYEAWVNTTLAAITKISKNDKLFLEKQNIIRQFQKSLEAGAESPEIVHEDYNNELYTGKIKIKHRRASKSNRQPLITSLLDKDFSM